MTFFMETGKGIVIASADYHFKHGLREQLTFDNYQVVGDASTFNEARDLSEKLKPGLVVMEMDLVNSDRRDYNGQVYLFTKRQDTLFFSDNGVREIVEGAIRFGAKGYILKSDSLGEFSKAVSETISGNWYIPDSLRGVESQIITDLIKPKNNKLTPREWEVLDWIAKGLQNKQIAAQLNIGVRTVETHRERVMRKLNVHNAAGLTRYAISTGRLQI